mmetsp:Transcript_22038/g.27075  ORF Transcript_22038/g.27075 Transcript_22038/m.27075 type:complete len:124 (-) Transcript_22038:738-1109(-)
MKAEGVASPPLKVRGSQKKLGDSPLPNGYIQMPIFNHIEPSMADDLELTGCDYVNNVDGYRFPAEDTYFSVEWLKEDLRAPISDAFNLTKEASENMSFMDLYGMCDVIQSNIFEGLGAGYNYT